MITVLLSGGSGSRLWPVSRALHPKQFIRLSDGQSLLQKTFARSAGLPGVSEILIVTNRELLLMTQDELSGVPESTEAAGGRIPTSFILEPCARNTAPAIAMTALLVAKKRGRQEVMLALPADHLIEKEEAFAKAVQKAAQSARAGKVVVFGITPSSPETGYGYLECAGDEDGDSKNNSDSDHADDTLLRFVEKPSRAKAEEYLASGRFLWNAGIFCFTAGTMLQQMERHCPRILSVAQDCFARSHCTDDAHGLGRLDLNEDSFCNAPDESIDYAVMEKTKQAALVRCDIGWNDIGSWRALGDLTDADSHGNRIVGDAVLHEVKNCTLRSDKRVIGAAGVEDLLIIDSADALLVAAKSRAQDVKHLYAQLKNNDHDAHKLHPTVYRPWGSYTVLEEGARFKVKRIEVKPGARLSLQLHHHRSEHWVVVSGRAGVIVGERQLTLEVNESTYIPVKHKHRLENIGTELLIMIEVQTGDYLGEDDIVRFDDEYGRVADK